MDGQGGPDDQRDEMVWSARLGAHLEAARVRAGLRRTDVASRLGVSEETIRLWERGSVQPTQDRLARLIAMLSIEASLWQAHDGGADADEDELPALAQRLRAERAARGLAQRAVAQLLGVAQPTYAAWETGRATPGDAHHQAIAAFLGLEAAEVVALCEVPLEVDWTAWPPLGQAIGRRRQALQLTRAALAARLEVPTKTLVSWELGYRTPRPTALAALAEALDVPLEDLAGLVPARAASRLGDLILRRQRELGLRSADVARLVGTTESTLSRWINGHAVPVRRNLERLADVLALSYADLATAANHGGPTA